MSRIGKKPITIPAGVEVKQDGNTFTVKGPKGQLVRELSSEIKVNIDGNEITFERPNDLPNIRALHGTTRANLNNMIVGVSEGFTRGLELVGVGYRVQASGKGLTLSLGYSHPVEMIDPEGITTVLDGQNIIKVQGIDKEKVGQFAAEIRDKRRPEPYKGKGIKYATETIRRKVGKTGKK